MIDIFRVARYYDDRVARLNGAGAGDLYVEVIVEGQWTPIPSEGSWPSFEKIRAEAHVAELNRQAYLADIPDIFDFPEEA